MNANPTRLPNPSRDTTFSLAALLAFGLLRAVFATAETPFLDERSLAPAFMEYLDPNIAFFFFVPLFCFCIFRRTNVLLAAQSATRFASRRHLLQAIETVIALHALAFAAIIVATALPPVLVQGGSGASLDSIVSSTLLQMLFQAVFFLTVGTIYVAVRLTFGAGALPFAAALFYAGIDALIQTLELTNVRTLWTGWLIIGYADPTQPLLALSGLLRLGAILAIGTLAASRTVSRMDFLSGGGQDACA